MRGCLHALLQYRVALLGNRDGSDQPAHLRNLIRFFFFLRWMFIPKAHSGLQKIQKRNTQQLYDAGYYNAEISLHKAKL